MTILDLIRRFGQSPPDAPPYDGTKGDPLLMLYRQGQDALNTYGPPANARVKRAVEEHMAEKERRERPQ